MRNLKPQIMNNTLPKTDFNFPNVTNFYKGKVRDVYTINNDYLMMIVSDRLSAFDVVLPKAIPYKGQVLNQIATIFLDATNDIIPNWKIASPDPMATFGKKCNTFPVEMIIRSYLTGSSWRTYKNGGREICGVPVPDGMKEHQRFPEPIITPTTKADQGSHDADISKEEILKQGLVSEEDYEKLEYYTKKLFQRGSEMAAKKGLILVDTKYEFGKIGDEIYLIDEIHTPDSSRYFYADGYEERQMKGLPQKQLSKEFVREWLMKNGFQGHKGQKLPELSDEFISMISNRYIELFEIITGQKFIADNSENVPQRVEKNVISFLENYFK